MFNAGAIIILSGGLVKDESGRWRTANYDEGDNFGVTGDRIRIVASAFTFNDNPEQIVIVSGGYGQYEKSAAVPTLASVMAEELQALGVPKENIIQEANSGTTYQQLLAVAKILAERKIKTARLVSNDYHLPRIAEFIETGGELKKILKGIEIKLLSAEKIVLKQDPEYWELEIKKAYASDGMKKRIEMEKQGVSDIRAGRYKYS